MRASPDFGGVKKVVRWMPVERESSSPAEPLELDWLQGVIEFFVRAAEVALWVGLALAVGVLVFALALTFVAWRRLQAEMRESERVRGIAAR